MEIYGSYPGTEIPHNGEECEAAATFYKTEVLCQIIIIIKKTDKTYFLLRWPLSKLLSVWEKSIGGCCLRHTVGTDPYPFNAGFVVLSSPPLPFPQVCSFWVTACCAGPTVCCGQPSSHTATCCWGSCELRRPSSRARRLGGY